MTVCFAAGTRILTTEGEIPVEKMSPGNLAISPTGTVAKITWLGSYAIDLKASADREHLSPIRIRQNALADGVPHRDLFLSRHHGLFVDGVIIPVRLLVNDLSIVRDDSMDSIEYWHIELPRHGFVVAEGAAAESYLEWRNRSHFTFSLGSPRQGSSPFAARYALGGDVVDAACRRLSVRAQASRFIEAHDALRATETSDGRNKNLLS
jgi:Hint domain-containing protein